MSLAVPPSAGTGFAAPRPVSPTQKDLLADCHSDLSHELHGTVYNPAMRVRCRLSSFVLLLATAAASWYGFMLIHELGHVLAAWLSGGRVARVVLSPLAFSRTDMERNPHALFVAAAGAAWGSLFPLASWLVARAGRLPLAFLLRAFAGFCLLANGAYLASAAIMPAGDAEDMLRLGASLWAVVTPGIAACVGGLTLWNGLGPHFGLGDRPVERNAVIAATISLALLLIGMTAWSCL